MATVRAKRRRAHHPAEMYGGHAPRRDFVEQDVATDGARRRRQPIAHGKTILTMLRSSRVCLARGMRAVVLFVLASW